MLLAAERGASDDPTGCSEVTDLLESYGAKWTLDLAVRADYVKEVEHLVAEGADVNAEYSGRTPLMWAALHHYSFAILVWSIPRGWRVCSNLCNALIAPAFAEIPKEK